MLLFPASFYLRGYSSSGLNACARLGLDGGIERGGFFLEFVQSAGEGFLFLGVRTASSCCS